MVEGEERWRRGKGDGGGEVEGERWWREWLENKVEGGA